MPPNSKLLDLDSHAVNLLLKYLVWYYGMDKCISPSRIFGVSKYIYQVLLFTDDNVTRVYVSHFADRHLGVLMCGSLQLEWGIRFHKLMIVFQNNFLEIDTECWVMVYMVSLCDTGHPFTWEKYINFSTVASVACTNCGSGNSFCRVVPSHYLICWCWICYSLQKISQSILVKYSFT